MTWNDHAEAGGALIRLSPVRWFVLVCDEAECKEALNAKRSGQNGAKIRRAFG